MVYLFNGFLNFEWFKNVGLFSYNFYKMVIITNRRNLWGLILFPKKKKDQ